MVSHSVFIVFFSIEVAGSIQVWWSRFLIWLDNQIDRDGDRDGIVATERSFGADNKKE